MMCFFENAMVDLIRPTCCWVIQPLVNIQKTYKKLMGKSPCLMGELTVSMAMFNSYLYVYQWLTSVMITASKTATKRGVQLPQIQGIVTFWAALQDTDLAMGPTVQLGHDLGQIHGYGGHIPSGKLTQLLKMAIYSEFSHYLKMVIFHSYVSLPEGSLLFVPTRSNIIPSIIFVCPRPVFSG